MKNLLRVAVVDLATLCTCPALLGMECLLLRWSAEMDLRRVVESYELPLVLHTTTGYMDVDNEVSADEVTQLSTLIWRLFLFFNDN